MLMELLSVVGVDERAELFAGLETGLAGADCQEPDKRLDLLVDNLFVFLLTFKDQLVNVLEVFDIVQQCLEVDGHILFQRS